MRPRKWVLLCCEDEKVSSELRLLLDVWHFAGVCVPALDAWTGLNALDCILVVSRPDGYWCKQIELLKRGNPGTCVILLVQGCAQLQTLADRVVYDGGGMAALREALRIATARKRGPKKAFVAVAERAVA